MLRRPFLALALVGLATTPSLGSLTLTVSGFSSPVGPGGGSFQFVESTTTIDLVDGVAQTLFLDNFVGGNNVIGGTLTGQMTTTMTLGGVTHTYTQDYSKFVSVITLSAGTPSPIIFDLGAAGTVTVTPIASTDSRRATFLLSTGTPTAVPEPSTLAGALVGVLGLLGYGLRRRS